MINKTRFGLVHIAIIIILLAAFFLRQHKLMDYPFFADELENGDIALEILKGNIAPFYPHAVGQEALYHYPMALSFVVFGDSVLANRWPSVAWSMVFVALMYVYGQRLFHSRRVGVLAAGLTAALWWPAVFAHVGLRAVSLPVTSVPALLGLVAGLQASSDRRAMQAGIVGGIFAGLTAYTYTSGRGFPAVLVLFLLYALVAHRKQLFKRWRVFLAYTGLMIAVSAWLYVYLYLHPEYDLRIGFAREGLDLILQGDWKGLAAALSATLGMFTIKGESVWLYNITGRPVFVGPEGWLFYLGLLLCLWRWRRPEYALQLFVIGVMLVPTLLTEHPPSWTRSIGLLPGLLVATVLPIEWLANILTTRQWPNALYKRAAKPMYTLLTLLVILLGISVYWRTAYDMLEVWMNHPGVYWMTMAFYGETADYINRSPDSIPLNYNMDVYVPWRKTNLQRPIQRKDVAVRWTINNAFVFPKDSCSLRLAFQIYAAPAPALQAAFIDVDTPIYIGPRADPSGQHILRVYNIPCQTFKDHLARAQAAKVFLPHSTTPISAPVEVGPLNLLGYELLNPDAQAGERLYMLTYWSVRQRPPNMATFLHLLDQAGELVAQYDGFDVVVDDLMPGDIVVQLHTLELPTKLASGVYRFQIGAYTRDSLERLPLNVDSPDRLLWLDTWQPVAAP